ncbi:uncharacterized protein si:ch211-168f7.5 isoform X1 [Brienomyrus brachyistius]|uniref:uncharacterized protein si:ch211-168f7.5 isoform X1 n=2 Tax=Brienomyrus brachyistius TaxID=42636 RepID=UPI0020B17E0D|nr:uncharacterized protein si:ch211-168f7.5 isoform X1 [Brienomyrus brachyistius]
MAGRRGCVTSLWSGSERVRIGERLKASLAGIVELDLLRCRHWEMVEAVLGRRAAAGTSGSGRRGPGEAVAADGVSSSRRQQGTSPLKPVLPYLDGMGASADWSALSWDLPSEPLSTPTPDSSCANPLECDSRPSSGFYSVSGSSLSDSCCSVCSDGAQGAVGTCVGSRGGCCPWDCRPHSADHSASQWQDAKKPPSQSTQAVLEKGERRPFSTGDLEISGLLFLSDFCSALGEDPSQSIPGASLLSRLQLDPKFCSDLVSRKTKEVYPYPSPLHAVALQSPLFTSCQDPPAPAPTPDPCPDLTSDDQSRPEAPVQLRNPAPPNMARLDQYISKLVLRYHSKSVVEPVSRLGSRKWHTGPSRGSSQSLASFDSHSAAGVTQRRSLFGNSGGSSCRNSINLGNLPSLNGDGVNLNLHLNLNLNLNPNLNVNTTLDIDSNDRKGSTSSCDHLGNDTPTPTPSPSSSFSASAWRGRKRISTCPQTVNHRGSLEIAGRGFGTQGFSRSLDWSGITQEEAAASQARICESSPKICADSERVCEIARVSGLPRSVVAGLLEEGVELDADCFRSDEQEEACPAPAATSRSPISIPAPFLHPALPQDVPKSQPEQPSTWWGPQLQYHSASVPEMQPAAQAAPPCLPESRPPQEVRALGLVPATHSPSHFDCHPSALAPQRSPSPRSSPCEAPPPERRAPPQPRALFVPPPLSVFQRSSPTQSSLPRLRAAGPPPEGDLRPRGGSLRQEAGWCSGGGAWRGGDGERLYRGKHASRELVRASTVTGFVRREGFGRWDEAGEDAAAKRGASFRKRLEGLFGGREKERWRGSEMDRGRRKAQIEEPPSAKKAGETLGQANSGLPLAGSLFRCGSQGFLEARPQRRDARERRQQWVSSLEIARAGLGHSAVGLSLEQSRPLAVAGGGEDERLSSTASLFHLSRSQSPEGSCPSLSPLSSPSLSPPPPPPPRLTRSRSFRDLGRKVFGSVKPFTFKTQSLRK